nr:DNA methyltransferase [uncultured Deefgea sp.]
MIVGNPPFLGDKVMRSELGDEYVNSLRQCYEGQVPGGADLVMYWFEKARQQIENGQARAAGLVSTNSIRQKRNRVILEQIIASTQIFNAWSDEEWVNDGADVRVSLVCFGESATIHLNGDRVGEIHADLTASEAGNSMDLTIAQPLEANKKRSFFGLCLAGPFKVDSATALQWLQRGGNTNQRPNSDVVRPIYNGNNFAKTLAHDLRHS